MCEEYGFSSVIGNSVTVEWWPSNIRVRDLSSYTDGIIDQFTMPMIWICVFKRCLKTNDQPIPVTFETAGIFTLLKNKSRAIVFTQNQKKKKKKA